MSWFEPEIWGSGTSANTNWATTMVIIYVCFQCIYHNHKENSEILLKKEDSKVKCLSILFSILA